MSTFGNSTLTDNKIGTLSAERFEYNLDKQSISAEEKVKFVDKDKNTYYFSKLNSDDKFNEIVGTDINAELNKDLNQAYTWIKQSTSSDPKYWTLHLQAKIELSLGKKTEALESATKSKKLAEEGKNLDYVGLNDRLIKSIK